MEKKWDKYFLPPFKQQKDPDTSSVFSYNSNATEASTNQKQQVISYEPNIPQKITIQRPPITRYGADIPKEILDNIPAFEGKQGELSQFLNTIESYYMMYRVCKTDLVPLHTRGKARKIISHQDIKRKLMNNYGSTRSGIKASVKISKLSMSSD